MTLSNPLLGWLSWIDRRLGADGARSDHICSRAEVPDSRRRNHDGLGFRQEEPHWRDDEEREREFQILLSCWM